MSVRRIRRRNEKFFARIMEIYHTQTYEILTSRIDWRAWYTKRSDKSVGGSEGGSGAMGNPVA